MTLAAPAAAAEPESGTNTPTNEGPPRSSGLRLGLRTGMAVPIGQAFTAGGAMSDTIKGYVPLRLDVGYRFLGSHLYVGAVGQVAAIVPTGCATGESCSGSDLRVGALVAVHVLPSHRIDPWIGAGMGYERLKLSRSLDGASVDFTASGVELFDLELGADWRATRALRLGPVLSSSIGHFTAIAVNGTPTRDFDSSLHAWVMLGIRGAYDL